MIVTFPRALARILPPIFQDRVARTFLKPAFKISTAEMQRFAKEGDHDHIGPRQLVGSVIHIDPVNVT